LERLNQEKRKLREEKEESFVSYGQEDGNQEEKIDPHNYIRINNIPVEEEEEEIKESIQNRLNIKIKEKKRIELNEWSVDIIYELKEPWTNEAIFQKKYRNNLDELIHFNIVRRKTWSENEDTDYQTKDIGRILQNWKVPPTSSGGQRQ